MDLPDSREYVKIWQRTRGEAPPIIEMLPSLAAGALSRAALYGELMRRMQDPGHKALHTLQDGEQHFALCIKGIYRMAAGTRMHVSAVAPQADTTQAALRKAYGQTRKALHILESGRYDPEFGPVFAALGADMQLRCCKLAEIMGLLRV